MGGIMTDGLLVRTPQQECNRIKCRLSKREVHFHRKLNVAVNEWLPVAINDCIMTVEEILSSADRYIQIEMQKSSILFFFLPTINSRSPTCSRPSFCAAPPSMILVTYMLLSPGMCWFPTPPAILKPSPVFPWKQAAGWSVVGWLFSSEVYVALPFGPLMSLISMMVSIMGLRRRTYSRTIEPATFRASTALL